MMHMKQPGGPLFERPAPPEDSIVRDPAELSFADVVDCRLRVCRSRRKSTEATHRCVVLAIIRPQLREKTRAALAQARQTSGGCTWNALVPCLELEHEDSSEWDAPEV